MEYFKYDEQGKIIHLLTFYNTNVLRNWGVGIAKINLDDNTPIMLINTQTIADYGDKDRKALNSHLTQLTTEFLTKGDGVKSVIVAGNLGGYVSNHEGN